MKGCEYLPKTLPVPPYLDEKVLGAASRFLVRRRCRRRIAWGFGAAAAALLIAGAFIYPLQQRVARAELAGLADWSALDQECFDLSSEMNVCFPNDGDWFL
ncbi:MAG: hypothetical protein MJ016_08115 [Victivallaceae bacterium]|nr:hypothetical protein [Victivallaceae bacterium]